LELFQIYPNIWEKKSSKPPTRCWCLMCHLYLWCIYFLSGRFWWSFWLTFPPLYLVWTRVRFFVFILRIGLWMSSHSIAISSKVYHIS
jgi:hypothetical protein